MADKLTKQTLVSDMFVIWQEHTGYRASKSVNGKLERYTTPDIELADMFRSKESALDHLFFTLSLCEEFDQLVDYYIKPVRLRQEIENTYMVGEVDESTRVGCEDLV